MLYIFFLFKFFTRSSEFSIFHCFQNYVLIISLKKLICGRIYSENNIFETVCVHLQYHVNNFSSFINLFLLCRFNFTNV